MAWLLDWWDAIELWLVQLPYPVQIVLIVGVLLPLCWAATRVVDRVADLVEGQWARMRTGRRSANRKAEGTST